MERGTSKKSPLCFGDLVEEERDIYDNDLEQAVCRADFFRENGLRLIRHADLLRLQTQGGKTPEWRGMTAALLTLRGRYLLCRGERVLAIF